MGRAGNVEIEATEIGLLLEGVFRRTGYDFRAYAPDPVSRALRRLMEAAGVSSVSSLQERVLRDDDLMERLLEALSGRKAGWFDDPPFFRRFRREVVPRLKTYAYVRIWVPGCSSGEEVYSLAMTLAEERLHDRCQVYGTDLASSLLDAAKRGAIPLKGIEAVEERHRKGGARRPLADHYTPSGEHGILAQRLREMIVFGQHSLAVDRSFNEFNLIVFRGGMSDFTAPLRLRVYSLFHESLARLGILALGRGDTLKGSADAAAYRPLGRSGTLMRRMT